MSWSTPRTWATGEIVTAANMNTYLSNNLSFLGSGTVAVIHTSQTTTSGSYTDLATVGPTVTVTTLTTVLIIVSAGMSNTTAPSSNIMSAAVSGATTLAASDQNSVQFLSAGNGYGGLSGFASLLSGLTAGSNTFTAKYRNNGGTSTFNERNLTIIPLTV